MNTAAQLKRMGCSDDQIANATVGGKPLSECERTTKRSDGWPGKMNKLERQYAMFLDDLVVLGSVVRYRFEKVKVRLADRTWYTPDFQVWLEDGRIAMVETKGFCRDDAAVKFKVAREMYPEYHWMMAGRKGGAWKVFMGETLAELVP